MSAEKSIALKGLHDLSYLGGKKMSFQTHGIQKTGHLISVFDGYELEGEDRKEKTKIKNTELNEGQMFLIEKTRESLEKTIAAALMKLEARLIRLSPAFVKRIEKSDSVMAENLSRLMASTGHFFPWWESGMPAPTLLEMGKQVENTLKQVSKITPNLIDPHYLFVNVYAGANLFASHNGFADNSNPPSKERLNTVASRILEDEEKLALLWEAQF